MLCVCVCVRVCVCVCLCARARSCVYVCLHYIMMIYKIFYIYHILLNSKK